VAGFLAGAAGRVAAPLARPAVHAGLFQLFRGGDDAVLDAPASDGDAGWFGPDSVTWRVHADPSMFVGGIVALAFQALHPLPMAGVSDHSDFRTDPLGRLRRTAAFVGVTAYGTSADAARACKAITKVHAGVVGTAPDGRAYSAADPELLGWVHAAEFAGFAAAHRRFGSDPMTRGELDRYVEEVATVGEALGVVDPPRSWPELHAVLERHRPGLEAGDQARSAWHFLEHAHEWLPAPARPAYRVLFRGAVACLPPWARALWDVRMPSAVEIATCRSLVRWLGALVGDPPRLVEARRRAAA
jgi:uncharacterized protein (DUF2236 family)